MHSPLAHIKGEYVHTCVEGASQVLCVDPCVADGCLVPVLNLQNLSGFGARCWQVYLSPVAIYDPGTGCAHSPSEQLSGLAVTHAGMCVIRLSHPSRGACLFSTCISICPRGVSLVGIRREGQFLRCIWPLTLIRLLCFLFAVGIRREDQFLHRIWSYVCV